MNRCITCGKIVTRPKAQNSVEHDGLTYLVCCPLCEKEFLRDPAHYTAVARSLFGSYAVRAHSQASPPDMNTEKTPRLTDEMVRMIRSTKESFDELRRLQQELAGHLDRISTSGGLEGLRTGLNEHRQMTERLREQMAVHAGVCSFVLSVSESAAARRPVS